MTYFTINELTQSDTAKKKKIDNTPDEKITKNLNELIAFLNPLREAWGSAIRISSGYRCKALNEAVNGSKTSVHTLGWAVDMCPANGEMEEFKKFVVGYLKDKKFDQCIIEKSGKTEWIHLGLYNNANKQRRMVFKLDA